MEQVRKRGHFGLEQGGDSPVLFARTDGASDPLVLAL